MARAEGTAGSPGKPEKIGQSIVPVVQPVRGMRVPRGSPLLARIDLFLRWHVLLAPDAEVALDGATTHGTSVEFAETGGTDARVPARQQCPGQWEILANYAQLLAGAVPQGALAAITGPRGDEGVARIGAVVWTGFRESQSWTQA